MSKILITDGGGGALPEEYIQLEYIQSSGTQYIDTGIIGSGSEKVELKYQYQQLGSTAGGTGRIFGSRTNSTTNNMSFGSISGNLGTANDRYFFGYNNTDSGQLGLLIDTNSHIFYYDPAGFKIDDIQIWSATPATFTTPTNLRIFGFVNNNSMGYGLGRAYYCKIWDNNNLIRNLVPAKRKSDNAIGMYDTVSNNFFENAGTGSFTGGPIVGSTEITTSLQVLVTPIGLLDKTVTFKVNGDTKQITSVPSSTPITAPSSAIASVWKDENSNVVSFPLTPTSDMTLYGET